MNCPYCSTDNRDDAESCYHCGKDISMLRLIVNKARHHYNVALEHAERQRYAEALTELEHALELDRSYVPAHVVMGTVYAKMEKFAEAKRCWQAALALDPHVLKAHEYLDKSDLARRAAPVIRRVRWAGAIALLAAAVFVVATIWQLRPSPDNDALTGVIAAIEQGDYDSAFRGVQRLAQTGRRGDVRRTARLLEHAIGQRYESAGLTMMKFLLENKPIEARRLYRSLASQQSVPEPYRRHLALLDEQATDQAGDLVGSWERAVEAGDLTFAELEAKTNALRQVFDQPELLERVDGVLGSARRTWVAETLRLVPTEPASTSETLTWLGRLDSLADRAPESRDEIASASAQLVSAAMDSLGRRATEALAAKDRTALRSVLADLAHFESRAESAEVQGVADKALDGLRRLEIGQLSARLTAATTADIPEVDGWIASFLETTSVAVESVDELADLVRRTRRRLAAEMLRWCTSRDPRFEEARITEEEARWTVERAEFVLRYVVGQDWRYVKDNVTFYAAVSWLVLGDTGKALHWIDRLEKDYPESPYLSLAKRYRQEIQSKTTSPPGEAN